MYALALLSFTCKMLIILAIFFTIKATTMVSRALKNQSDKDLSMYSEFYVFSFTIYISRLMRHMKTE